jgi:hypothetical protein
MSSGEICYNLYHILHPHGIFQDLQTFWPQTDSLTYLLTLASPTGAFSPKNNTIYVYRILYFQKIWKCLWKSANKDWSKSLQQSVFFRTILTLRRANLGYSSLNQIFNYVAMLNCTMYTILINNYNFVSIYTFVWLIVQFLTRLWIQKWCQHKSSIHLI